MVYIKLKIICYVMYNIVVNSLVQLPQLGGKNIEITEKIYHDTINNLFAALNIKNLKLDARLNYGLSGNYLLNSTLGDYSNLKEITRQTHDNGFNNNTLDLIANIDKVLNKDAGSKAADDFKVNKYIEKSIEKLRYLRQKYRNNENLPLYHIDTDILKLSNKGNVIFNNTTFLQKQSKVIDTIFNQNVTGNHEFWSPSARRIYKGKRMRIQHFPFMASVLFFEKFQCGGSIIKSDLVITASSCLQLAWNNRFFRENPSFLSVRIGSHHSGTGGEIVPVLEIYFHPGYNPKTLRHNLAIMRLQRRIHFSKDQKKVKKIDIDRNPSRLPPNFGRITVIGWGAKDITNVLQHPASNKLAFAELDIYPQDDCRDIYTGEYVTKTNFCAGFMSAGGGACNHDVGGPGVAKGKLIGVISFGSFSCGKVNTPTVFTKVGYYTDWIELIMEQDIPQTYYPEDSLSKKQPNDMWLTSFKTTTFKFTPINKEGRPVVDIDIEAEEHATGEVITDKAKKNNSDEERLYFMKDVSDENERLLRIAENGKAFEDALSVSFGTDDISGTSDSEENETLKSDSELSNSS